MTHRHHIIPKHMGGSDIPQNIVELSVREHADAHLWLWEEHGHWQDLIAWKCLSGQITNAEAIRLAGIRANTGRVAANKGIPMSEEQRRKISAARKGQKHSTETKQKIAAALKGNKYSTGHKNNLGTTWTPEMKGRASRRVQQQKREINGRFVK